MIDIRTARDVRVSIVRGVLGALVLGLLQAAWYYVANVPVMAEVIRGIAKSVLFWSGVAVVLAVSLRSALTGRTTWRRDLIVATVMTIGGASFVDFVIDLLLGRSFSSNSLLLGQPSALRIVAGIATFLAYIATLTALAFLCGALVRTVLPRHERPDSVAGPSHTP